MFIGQLTHWFIGLLVVSAQLLLLCYGVQEIGSLKRLTQLDVSDNKLERLPDTIGQLDSLTDLLLSDNQIDYLPDAVGLCPFVALNFLYFTTTTTWSYFNWPIIAKLF